MTKTYVLTLSQYTAINASLPTGQSFGYISDGQYLFDATAVSLYDIDLDSITQDLYALDLQPFLDTLDVYSVDRSIGEFKIGDYADRHFSDMPFNLFDFKTMLRRESVTNKTTTMLANGRPNTSSYWIEGVLMGKLYYIFTTDSDGFITNRTEELVYIGRDDTESERICIKNKSYDLTDTSITDASIVLSERRESRNTVLQSMKTIAGGTLKARLSLTMAEVAVLIEPFWAEYGTAKVDFIDIGGPGLLNGIIAMDVATTPYTWILEEVVPGVTIRDYMIATFTGYYST